MSAPPIASRGAARELVRETIAFAWADMRAIHTWKTYTFGWLTRLLLQVVFFALAAGFAGRESALQYSLVGNAVALGTLEGMIIVTMMVQERMSGTLPLLAIAPTSHVPVYLGRGVQWLASGMVSSTLAFVLLPPLAGVPLPWPRAAAALPIIAVVCVASYSFGCVLASVALRHVGMTWVILNLGYLPIMAFCGVNVPSTFWPPVVRAISEVLPLTHGLRGVRGVVAGAPVGTVLVDVALEVLVGALWMAVAVLSIRRVVTRGVADGTLDLGA
ncbi:ABC transporter permease [Cellulomonas sp. P22]|uniref:ABC transporter permease n=1 Tax=Cellulomonas sp. P22 TaxID=3373189 RepID=UPI00378BFD96